MKRLIRFFSAVPSALNILFIISLITIFLIGFVLSNVPEIFRGGAKLGEIIYRICLSIMSSYVFYLFVVHLKSQKDKRNIYDYIAKNTDRIIGDAKSLIQELKKESKYDFDGEYPTLNDTIEMCKKVNPNAKAPLLLGGLGNYASWIQYLEYYKNRTEKTIRKIYTQMPFLDSAYLKLIVNIEDCGYFYTIGFVVSVPMRNTDLSAFAKELHEYLGHVEALDKYARRKFKYYK